MVGRLSKPCADSPGWAPVLFASSGAILAIGGALGMLQGAVRFQSRDPAINAIFMEMALIFAPFGASLEAMHQWSEENAKADDLSRNHLEFLKQDFYKATVHSLPSTIGWKLLGSMPTPPRPERGRRR